MGAARTVSGSCSSSGLATQAGMMDFGSANEASKLDGEGDRGIGRAQEVEAAPT